MRDLAGSAQLSWWCRRHHATHTALACQPGYTDDQADDGAILTGLLGQADETFNAMKQRLEVAEAERHAARAEAAEAGATAGAAAAEAEDLRWRVGLLQQLAGRDSCRQLKAHEAVLGAHLLVLHWRAIALATSFRPC